MSDDVPVGEGVYRVVGACTVVRTPDGSAHYLYKSALFDAETVTAESVEHLVSVGLIAKVEDPAGDQVPTEKWTSKQLDAYAKQRGISLAAGLTKAEKVAAIAAALEKK